MSNSNPIAQPPFNATFMGVAVGAANHYGSSLAPMELYCESGFAFALNIAPDLCPSGPYCWNHESVLKNLRQLGLNFKYLPLGKNASNRNNIVEDAMNATREAVLSVESLEHQLVARMNQEEFELAMPWGPDADACIHRVAIADLPKDEPPIFGFYRIDKGDLASKRQRVLQGLECALEMHTNSAEFQSEGYRFGLSAYEVWSDALQANEFNGHGHWWNSQVWSECRSVASQYFSNWEFGDCKETRSLAKSFSEVSDFLSKAAPHELGNMEKAALVQEAAAVEAGTPALLRDLISKWDATKQ